MDELKDRIDSEPNGLTRALQRHREPVPADFTAKVLRRLRQAQERKILACVILKERLALAGCIIFSCIAFVVVRVFPEIAEVVLRNIAKFVTYKGEALADRILQTIIAFSTDWQTYTILAVALGFAAYNIFELFRHENLKTT